MERFVPIYGPAGEILLVRFSEDQPRNPDGKFASGGGKDLSVIKPELDRVKEFLDKHDNLFSKASIVGSWAAQDPNRMPDRKGPGTSDIDLMIEQEGGRDKITAGGPKTHWGAVAKFEGEFKKEFDRPIHMNIEKVLGGNPSVTIWEKKSARSLRFSEDQPRDSDGKFGSGGFENKGTVKTTDKKVTTYSSPNHTIVIEHDTKESKVIVKHLDKDGDLLTKQTHDSIGAARKELQSQGIDHKFHALRNSEDQSCADDS